jgi:hypothetical protein
VEDLTIVYLGLVGNATSVYVGTQFAQAATVFQLDLGMSCECGIAGKSIFLSLLACFFLPTKQYQFTWVSHVAGDCFEQMGPGLHD